ncbi:hypothetical protein [Telmatospirillum siberiense]|uniref:Uncharacterized protein n=1 Tax=Telmatospirillum siberiense TaxID=382514 RepID=A0A2N3PNZ4_9PROT|nr:hypothetical protein [Telmatospirillum siberiense]PKU22122.1 hypothetical protein CWS72_23060 [Telmatospirillum siberiense]
MIEIDVTHCWAELELGNRFRRSLRRHLREWLYAEIEERGFVGDATGFDRDPVEDQIDAMEVDVINRVKTAFRNRARMEIADYSPATLSKWLRRILKGELAMCKRTFLEDHSCGLDFLIVIASGAQGEIEMEVE